jgi:tripartite-type tricarboxylate transporter receptor subunit TctC
MKALKRMAILIAGVSVFAGHFVSQALAQDVSYPTRPIRWIVTWPAGGTTDVIARVVAHKVSELLKQPIIIDNRGGAAGVIGMRAGVAAEPDGYTFLVTDSAISSVTSLNGSLPFDPVKSLAPITMFALVPHIVVVKDALPVKTFAELIELAKSKPGTLNFSSGGIGSPLHLAGELIRVRAGISWLHVPYRGSGPAVTALLTGEADVATPTLPNTVSQVASGKIRALAVMSSKRSSLLPNVPSIEEVGLKGAEAFAYYGLSAPVGVPPAILDRMYKACILALKSTEVSASFNELGVEVVGNTPAEYQDFILSDTKKWSEVIKAAGIPLQTH